MKYPYEKLVADMATLMLAHFHTNESKDEERAKGNGFVLEPKTLYIEAARHFGRVAEALSTDDSDFVVNACVDTMCFLAMVAREEYAKLGFGFDPVGIELVADGEPVIDWDSVKLTFDEVFAAHKARDAAGKAAFKEYLEEKE